MTITERVAAVLRSHKTGTGPGLNGWATDTFRHRLEHRLHDAGRTLDALERRYHLPVEDTVEVTLRAALQWYQDRPLADDHDYPSGTASTEARALWEAKAPTVNRLKDALRSLRRAGDLMRDLHEELARAFDAAVEANKERWSHEQAWDLVVSRIIQSNRLALDPDMDEAAVKARLRSVPDAVFSFAGDADLFAPGQLKSLPGIGLIQAAIIALRFAEVEIRNSTGRRPVGRLRQSAGRHVLRLERQAAIAITQYFLRQRGQPLYPHAAVLLIAACPSPTLAAWQTAALNIARKSVPVRRQEGNSGCTPGDLSLPAYGVYARQLGDRLQKLLAEKT